MSRPNTGFIWFPRTWIRPEWPGGKQYYGHNIRGPCWKDWLVSLGSVDFHWCWSGSIFSWSACQWWCRRFQTRGVCFKLNLIVLNWLKYFECIQTHLWNDLFAFLVIVAFFHPYHLCWSRKQYHVFPVLWRVNIWCFMFIFRAMALLRHETKQVVCLVKMLKKFYAQTPVYFYIIFRSYIF